ncbi:amidohydrolase family protein [Roseburia hominis]|uniref:amidohydrolase family protein n=1 Tax=Roseburia hominis TaxID=301301 RepID=UPI002665AA5D|nr:amidohydrolase family protein [Roseburia hominis]
MEKHRKKLIKNATVFDGHSSGLAQGKKIVIEDDIVTEITADEVSEENFDEVFDGTGMVAMPGMTDAHVHMGCLFAKGEFPVDYATVLTVAKCKDALMAGFTTFRDAGSVSEGLKLAFDEGVLPGPRIYPCGAYISQMCGHGDSEYAHTCRDIQYRHPSSTVLADGVPEIIRAVREQFYRGASHIKLMATEILNRHEDIRLLFGTDMMITGPDYQVEQSEDIRYYEKRFGTMRALRALTGTANEVFALTTYQNPYPKGKIGVLEAGSYADLLLVDGDPTKSVSVLADTDHLRLIMKGGTVYKNTLC